MVRTPRIDKNGMKKGAWSPEEDNKLRAYIERYGHWNWRQLPKFAGLSRCGKSCRLRWMNYLRPDVRRGNYTEEEEDTIIKLHEQLGNKWSVIAAKLPGRTDNDIKNHWHTHLQKRTRISKSTTNIKIKEQTRPKSEDAKRKRDLAQKDIAAADVSPQHQPILESSSLSPEPSSSEISTLSSDQALVGGTNWFSDDSNNITSLESLTEPIDDFWTEPFLADTSYNHQSHFLSSPFVEGLLLPPYISSYDDTMDFLDPMMLEMLDIFK